MILTKQCNWNGKIEDVLTDSEAEASVQWVYEKGIKRKIIVCEVSMAYRNKRNLRIERLSANLQFTSRGVRHSLAKPARQFFTLPEQKALRVLKLRDFRHWTTQPKPYYESWYRNDIEHRLDGPSSIFHKEGYGEWRIEGEKISEWTDMDATKITIDRIALHVRRFPKEINLVLRVADALGLITEQSRPAIEIIRALA